MTVKELKQMLEGLDENLEVVIPLEPMEGFTGAFFSPCNAESGMIELGTEDLSEEDLAEYELLNKPIPQEPSFVLVPCGFFEEKHGVSPELN